MVERAREVRDRLTASDQRTEAQYRGYSRPGEHAHDKGMRLELKAVVNGIQRDGGRILATREETKTRELLSRALASTAAENGRNWCTAEERRAIAGELGLLVVDGKILIPDVQMTVERKWGEREVVNLEYASRNYRRSTIAAKSAAGFHVSGSNIIVRSAKKGPNIMGRLFVKSG